MICGRLFDPFSLQVNNTVYKRESAVCSAERSRAHNQKNFQLRSLLEHALRKGRGARCHGLPLAKNLTFRLISQTNNGHRFVSLIY